MTVMSGWSSCRVTLFVVVTLILLIQSESQFAHKYNVIVNAIHGPVEGFTIPAYHEAYDKKRINVFLGIPYAKRLTQFGDWRKEFRFRRPERPFWNGIWNATYYRPACPQLPFHVKQTVPGFNRFRDTSEDCLYMNIFAPNKTDERPVLNPPLYPVMVFIHGGGFTMGASNQYPGVFLAERNVIVVTFNYRLNALGFLSTGDNYSPGNYGMWDQQRALEFVKENIQAFRGNPSMITIFGQSTGGASVGLHILSPRSANLFQQAIMMSGSDRCEWTYIPSTDYVKQYAKELGDQLGCPTNDNQRLITCLQVSRTVDEIVNASVRVRIKQGTVGNPWGPVVDGAFIGANEAFLPDTPKVMREQGRFQKIRVMGGLVSDEGSFYIPKLSSLESGVSPAQYENIINEFLWDRNIMDMLNTKEALEFQYTYWAQPENYTMIRQELINMMSDYIFGSGMEDALKYQTLYNRTFFYVFDFKSRFDFLPPWRGVAHGQELQYVFGFPYVNETYNRLFGIYPRQEYDIDYSDRNISDYMMNLFTNFSDSGNPTALQYEKKYFRNTTWLEYNVYNHSYLYIGNKSENRINYRQQYFAFWREYFVQLSNRPSYFTTAAPSSQRASAFETATWSLTALAGLLVIITIALFIVICRRRPKDY